MERTRYPTFNLIFYWAILMLDEKMTLLQFFGHISLNNGPIWKIQKLAHSWECPLSFNAISRAFSRSGSVRGLALFRALGA